MADEKVNVSPEEKKAPEAPAPSGPGDPPAPEHTEGPAVPGGAHAEPAAGEHTQQTVLPDMGEDAPAPSGKVINLSDIQAADKGGKEASAPAPDKKAPEADKPPKRRGRPVEEGKIVYLKMSELHPFHTFREHPYKVQDDKAMDDLVGTIKEHGIMTPATVRPEKDGKGYEIIAGHRRHHGGTRAGLEEMPFIKPGRTSTCCFSKVGRPMPSPLVFRNIPGV